MAKPNEPQRPSSPPPPPPLRKRVQLEEITGKEPIQKAFDSADPPPPPPQNTKKGG